jgi:hypothetical protein
MTTHTTHTIRLSALDAGFLIFALLTIAASLYAIADAIQTTLCTCVEAHHDDD